MVMFSYKIDKDYFSTKFEIIRKYFSQLSEFKQKKKIIFTLVASTSTYNLDSDIAQHMILKNL